MSSNKTAATPLSVSYPVNSIVELTLSPDRQVVRGLVYCTDVISNSIVLKKSLVHTTVSQEVFVVNASSVLKKKIVKEVASSEEGAEEQAMPLANVTNKSLEDKEKRAIRLAEESFGHINQKATPEGQAVFDRLLKACNEVVWRGESIIVLNQIRVNAPYGKEDCKLLSSTGGATGALHEGSLDRVKKIVAVDATDRS
uniref:AD domain-containing protein n=1 Tax=Attheya septentrionalis TaxID=420275 RepID=A0A7S2UHC2_9STRA|mmetsp:Transcript_22616/g.40816  ORF Transcript_22616/g.40816 Transcript_22616/m.40816 type:complete len:198 (+) Transcript_22616:97-690(+)|eukprot:CAMPEP_0198305116 /NCGR_PEP_ID=MMETSP1449-20131203/57745_1 /TAXON_ID=420275 /ORGANISM="Attheya septentrionalis, Strain CCMP2084" /LENGTH=197 /DNA_ID=CAMNT_0044007647 /DNA_START=83 /DNA_END=676 /DNA_ORIENTATION=+